MAQFIYLDGGLRVSIIGIKCAWPDITDGVHVMQFFMLAQDGITPYEKEFKNKQERDAFLKKYFPVEED